MYDYAQGKFFLHYGDVTDPSNILHIIAKVQPDEIYNLSAQSHVQVSFELPYYTAHVDALGTLNVLEAIRSLGLINKTKFYQASTSELIWQSSRDSPIRNYTILSSFSPMELQSFMDFGLPKIIEKRMGHLRAMAFYSIMSRHCGVKHL